ncbi:MAG: heavy metal translocating P-type ATPase [Planctomycetota bacterium]|nr:MAG: heavy metal translocating P-type ATPase [Planctomycetota bacterium]
MNTDHVETYDMDADERGHRGPWWTYPPILGAIVSGLLLASGWLGSISGLLPEPLPIVFYIASMPFGGYWWAREGLEELIEEREIGIEVLMGVAAVGAAALGAWEEAAFLVFLYGAAEAVESLTFARTRSAIRALLDLAPKEARVLRNGAEVAVAATSLVPGDVFLVRPGESLATDGVVQGGSSSIDESPVTGESVPVDKVPGDPVYAGTLNRQGALTIEATRAFADNTLSAIIHLVEQAQAQKGRAQRFIDRFSRIYTPLVLVGAAGVAIVPIVAGGDPQEWVTRAITVVVAGAPCALVMSTPVAMAAGIGSAGRRGVLIKGGIHLEDLGTVKVVALDKTGTLTHGRPTVTDVVPFGGGDQEGLLALAASVERLSEHPLAQAIVGAAGERGIAPSDAVEFVALAGSGAAAHVDGRQVHVGSPDLFTALGVAPADENTTLTEELRSDGKTVVLVGERALEGSGPPRLVGLLAIRDEIRADAPVAIAEFHRAGIVRVAILSGDHPRTAGAIARELGIDDVRAGLRPQDKVEAVQALEREHGAVAMIGDGVNDAPALAQATVGIAMGVAGTDAAIEAADVALMADDLEKAGYALRVGRRARTISRQNIAFSLLVLAVLVPGAALGFFTIALVVIIHEAAELIAVANGLRVAQAS